VWGIDASSRFAADVPHGKDPGPASVGHGMSETPSTTVRRDDAGSRYVLARDGDDVAFAEFRDRGDVVVFPHTVVAAPLRGQGLGAVLVRAALDDVRSRGRRAEARCWYVAQFIDEHPEYADLLA
jgi:predicted GNAT family acetyltransferase